MAKTTVTKCDRCGVLDVDGGTVGPFKFTATGDTVRGDLCTDCVGAVRAVLPAPARQRRPKKPSTPFQTADVVQLD